MIIPVADLNEGTNQMMYLCVKVGSTQMTTEGFGFSIQDQHGAPLLSINYDTQKQSREAEALITKALQDAVCVESRP